MGTFKLLLLCRFIPFSLYLWYCYMYNTYINVTIPKYIVLIINLPSVDISNNTALHLPTSSVLYCQIHYTYIIFLYVIGPAIYCIYTIYKTAF